MTASPKYDLEDDEVELRPDDLCLAGEPALSTECARGCLITPVQLVEYAILEATPEFELALKQRVQLF